MSTIDDGGPAFPRPDTATDDHWEAGDPGMSLLDWFAGQAMAGMMANPNIETGQEQIASGSYHMAQEMLLARKRYIK